MFTSDGEVCLNTYDDPKITPITLKTAGETDKFKNQGFQLSWSNSEDAKPEDRFNLRVICDNASGEKKTVDDKLKITPENFQNGLEWETLAGINTATYTGPEGCMLFDLNTLIGPILKFMGVIEIILGLLLCFAGRKSIYIAFTTLAFVAITGFVFAMAMNLNLVPGLAQGEKGGLIGVLCGATVIGGIGAYLFHKFAKAWATIIAGGIACAMLVGVLLAGTPASSTIKTVSLVVGFFAGGFIVTKLGKAYVEVGITALIGAIIFFLGIGTFDPNFPSLTADNMKS